MLKPLNKNKFATNIIEDLGMLTKPGNKRKMRYVLLECKECKSPFEKSVDNAVRRKETLCDACKYGKKYNFTSKLLRWVTSSECVFECNRCSNEYTQSAQTNASKSNSGVCRKCKQEDLDSSITYENVNKKLIYNPNTGSLTYRYTLSNLSKYRKGDELLVYSDGRVKFNGSVRISKARICLLLANGYDIAKGKEVKRLNGDYNDYRLENLEVVEPRCTGYQKRIKRNVVGPYTRLPKYSQKEIKDAISTCEYKLDFKTKYPKYYAQTRRRGWLQELTKELKTYKRKWSLLSAYRESLKYNTREDFKRGCEGAYDFIRHNYPHYRDRIYRRMDFNSSCDNDTIYIWKVKGIPDVYKIGVTSARLSDYRIKYVANKANIEYDIVIIAKINNALEIENRLLKVGAIYEFPTKFNGSTEFRVMDRVQLNCCLDYIKESIDVSE